MKIRESRNGEITLSFTDIGKSCPSCYFLTFQICFLTLFGIIKFLRKFTNLQLYLISMHQDMFQCSHNPLSHRDTFKCFCKQSRPRSGSSCKSCLIRVYSVCLWKYDISDPILVDLTSIFLCYMYQHESLFII